MAIERTDYTHAAGTFIGTASAAVVTQQGFRRFTRNGVGSYTLICDEAISFAEGVADASTGANDPARIAQAIITTPGVVEVRCYDTLNNPVDALALRVTVVQITTGPAGDGTLPVAPTPIAPGGGVLSVFGRVGNVVAVLGDYSSSLISNLSTSPGATVTDALNALVAAIMSLTSSLISNVSTVAGATVTDALNTLAAIGTAPLHTIEPLPATDYYSAPSIGNPFAGETLVQLSVLRQRKTEDAFGPILGSLSFAGGSGAWIITTAIFTRVEFYDSGGVLRSVTTNEIDVSPRIRTSVLITATIDVSGADAIVNIYYNGTLYRTQTFGGSGGALPAGTGSVDLSFGENAGASLRNVLISGGGYRVGALITQAEQAEWWQDCIDAGEFVDSPIGLTAGWRVGSVAPGATWTPFVGAGDMIETGSVPYATRPRFQWYA